MSDPSPTTSSSPPLPHQQLQQPQHQKRTLTYNDNDNNDNDDQQEQHFYHLNKRTRYEQEFSSITSITRSSTSSSSSSSVHRRISHLPVQVLYLIMTHFSDLEILRLGQVNTQWHRASRTNLLWHQFHVNHFSRRHIVHLSDLIQCLCHLFRLNNKNWNKNFQNFENFGQKSIFDGKQGEKMEFGEIGEKLEIPIRRLYLSEMAPPIDSHHFCHLIQILPRLEEISFPMIRTRDQSINDQMLGQLSKMVSRNLIHVQLSTHRNLTDHGIYALSKHCHMLQSIHIDHCEHVTSKALVHLMKRCTDMRQLSALYCNRAHFTPRQLLQVGKCAKVMESLSIEWWTLHNEVMSEENREIREIDGENDENDENEENDDSRSEQELIYEFVTSAKQLKQLHIRSAVMMNGEMLSRMIALAPQLQRLTLHCSMDRTRLINASIVSSSLIELSISHCETISGLVIQCPRLKTLKIDSIQSFNCLSIDRHNNGALSELVLSSSRLENVQMDQFLGTDRFPSSLQRVELFDCTGIGRLNIASQELKELKLFLCNDMEELNVQCPNLNIFSVNACMQLTRANLDCDHLMDCIFFPLVQSQAPALDHLTIKSLTLQALSLPKCTNLRHVSVQCPQLTAINMSEFKMLESLELNCPKLQKLALSAPRMNFDLQFANQIVATCPEVNMFHVSNTPSLNDQSLQRICAGWSKLTALIIANCNGLAQPLIQAPLLKGLQFCECVNLVLPTIQCPMLRKLSFKDTHNLCDGALSVLKADCPDISSLEVTNCSSIRCPFISIPNIVELQLNQCTQMTHFVVSMSCTRLNKLTIVGAVNLQHIGVVKPSCLNISEIVLSQCQSLNDSSFQFFMSLCPLLKSLIVIGCHNLYQPTISIPGLRLVQFTECMGLVAPVIRSNALQSLSFRGCINLEVSDLSQVVQPVSTTMMTLSNPGQYFSSSSGPHLPQQPQSQQGYAPPLPPSFQQQYRQPPLLPPLLPPSYHHQQQQPQVMMTNHFQSPPPPPSLPTFGSTPPVMSSHYHHYHHHHHHPSPHSTIPKLPGIHQLLQQQPYPTSHLLQPLQLQPSSQLPTLPPPSSNFCQIGQIEIIGAKLTPCLKVPINVAKLVLVKCNRLQRLEINSNTLTCLITNDCPQLQQAHFLQSYIPPPSQHQCLFVANRTMLSSVSGTPWITNLQVNNAPQQHQQQQQHQQHQ